MSAVLDQAAPAAAQMQPLSEMEQCAVATAVRCMRRWLWRMPQDDMVQVASLRVLELRGRMDTTMPAESQLSFLSWSATGAIRDECRRLNALDGGSRRAPAARLHFTQDDSHITETGHLDTPESELAVKQCVEAICALPEPLPTVAALSFSGSSMQHIAQLLGVHQSRVSQLRHKLASLMLRYLSERTTAARPRR